jgi:hypothetical protein
MPRYPSTPYALTVALLRALDWVHRTGWLTRDDDTEVAARLYDTWRSSPGASEDRHALVEALWFAFSARHGDDVARHLTAIFAVSLESHGRSHASAGWPDT